MSHPFRSCKIRARPYRWTSGPDSAIAGRSLEGASPLFVVPPVNLLQFATAGGVMPNPAGGRSCDPMAVDACIGEGEVCT
jgi:hypothetical protein